VVTTTTTTTTAANTRTKNLQQPAKSLEPLEELTVITKPINHPFNRRFVEIVYDNSSGRRGAGGGAGAAGGGGNNSRSHRGARMRLSSRIAC